MNKSNKLAREVKKILNRPWANEPIKVEQCPMILDVWGTHTIGKGGDKVCCGARGKRFITPKRFTDKMKITALVEIVIQNQKEVATKLRRIICQIPITKGLADGGKIRNELTELVNSLEKK